MIEASDFLTIALLIVLEGLLSADNAMVMAIMVLELPEHLRHSALQYGLGGAFLLRIITTLLAFWLIHLTFVKVIGGLYLTYLPYQRFWGSGSSSDERHAPREAVGWLGMSAFWVTVVKVESMNLVFSVDSILAAVAMSPKIWVVIAGGILGIVAMRVVVGQLLALIQRYPVIVDGAFIIIAWVGTKLLLDYLHEAGFVPFEVPQWTSLTLIVTIFSLSVLYARRAAASTPVRSLEGISDDAARMLSDGGDV